MKKIFLIITITLLILLVGCSNNLTNNDSFLQPPELPSDYKKIYDVLEEEFNTFKLISPVTGENTSKINFYNIDQDEEQEAIVFVEKNNKISMCIVNRVNEDWQLKVTEAKDALDIEKLQMRDINNNGLNEILVSYVNEKNKNLSIYSLNGQNYREVFQSRHEIFIMENLDDDESLELIILKSLSGFGNKSAILYDIDPVYGNNEYVDEIKMDAYIKGYTSIKVGNYNDDKRGVFIDVNVDGLSYYTDLIIVEDRKIKNLFRSDESEYNYRTLRRKNNISRDIDGDGIIEVPLNEIPQGYEELSIENIPLFTNWYEYNEGKLKFKLSTYESFSNNVRFYFNENLPEKLSVIENDNEVRLVHFDDKEAKNLLSVIKVRREEYDHNKNKYLNDYQQIFHMDLNYVYLVNIFDTLDNRLTSSSVGKIVEIMNR